MDQTIIVKGLLSQLFPIDHPATPWLLRLMVIRDDLEYEFRSIWLGDDPSNEDTWRCTYFLRRISISLVEAHAVLSYQVGKESKRAKDDLMLALAPHIRAATAALDEANRLVAPLRNAVGAHLRPKYADPKCDGVEVQVLRNYPLLEGEARISLSDFHASTYRALTVNSLLFAWPDIDSDEKHDSEHLKFRDALLASVNKVLDAIDGLLIRHWLTLGLLKVPEGYDLAVPDPKTGEMRRLPPTPES